MSGRGIRGDIDIVNNSTLMPEKIGRYFVDDMCKCSVLAANYVFRLRLR